MFNNQGKNFHMRLGNTIGLQLIYNQFSHPNDRVIYRMPGTYAQWAVVHALNEDQHKVIQGVLAGDSAASGDPARDDLQGSLFMPVVYFPANSAKEQLTSGIEADARTHSSIASASGVFSTQHTISADAARGGRPAAAGIVLPKGTALIGISVCTTEKLNAPLTVSLRIDGKATALKATVPKGATTKYQAFSLGDYRNPADWISGDDKAVTFVPDGAVPARTDLRIVAFWRSNHLPVF